MKMKKQVAALQDVYAVKCTVICNTKWGYALSPHINLLNQDSERIPKNGS